MSEIGSRSVAVALLAHLRRARDHIDRHYCEALDLDLLADVAGVSKYHFVRSFEAAYGETPIRYLTRRRIERAQDLLRVANLTVTEVCMAGGGGHAGQQRQLVVARGAQGLQPRGLPVADGVFRPSDLRICD